MGQHLINPASAGSRQHDDYGANAGFSFTPACTSLNTYKKNSRSTRSFPVVQPRKVDSMGSLNHVA